MKPFEPLVSIEIEPRTTADQEKLAYGLQALMADDPTLKG